ncbi:MAG: 23S rRNA (adenine(2503)-C(2))-methyltransferase RlmN [Chloroflexota bacterium]|nr:MAG: 23S rRNA (adenine(2503)-C(2))-methyltransferase [Anaerolineaceae bacterium 4572_5.2]RLD05694.1 MAG: 23S rRNA (adenine(2503)-C(2))-methyltransferase RlmN [Chloroflexota bacterium]
MEKLIYNLDPDEIELALTSWGEPKYRAAQIWKGLYHHLWSTPEQFTTLPLKLRHKLAKEYRFSNLQLEKVLLSSDGLTEKILFRLPDEQAIETVLMHYPLHNRQDRHTACISTQVGCAMGCKFCATGQMGFHRHLSSGEIAEQVVYCARQLAEEGEQLTNVVVMGMGEPFHNYDATLGAIQRLNHPQGLDMGARRFTISTVGLVPAIRRFTKENSQINLAISLHAADDELRSSMLPINDKYPLHQLIDACQEYARKTSRRVTFEWALVRGVNDTPDQAHKLVHLLRGMLAHVNVIPLNPTKKFIGEATTKRRALAFQAILQKNGLPCTIRLRRGIKIQAGCGQLAGAQNT